MSKPHPTGAVRDLPAEAVDAPPLSAINEDGVDLARIRALKALTPTERAHLLRRTVAQLQRVRRNVRRL